MTDRFLGQSMATRHHCVRAPKAVIAALITLPAFAGDALPAQPQQITDLRPGFSDTYSSSPEILTSIGARAYFSASHTEPHGPLWVSDGTTGGTQPLFPDCAPTCPWVEPGFGGMVVGDIGLFLLNDSGLGLWRTDGTPGGTRKLLDGFVGWPSRVALLDAEGPPRLLLGLQHGDSSTTLWVTDGTEGGTHQLPGAPSLRSGKAHGAVALFSAQDASGTELWRSDGTTAGTRRFADLVVGPASSSPEGFAAVGNRVVFVATDAAKGRELWVTDGTPGGTRILRDLTKGAASTQFVLLPRAGAGERHAYFVARVGNGTPELWRTDGTPNGTVQLTSLRREHALPTSPSAYIQVDGDRVFFVADDGSHGQEIWTTLGTKQSTRLLRDICPGACNGAPINVLLILRDVNANRVGLRPAPPDTMIDAGGWYLFGADDGTTGRELWRTDGTSGGTKRVRDLCPGACSSGAAPWSRLGGRVIVAARPSGPFGTMQLWSSDGTANGTAQFTQFTHDGVGEVWRRAELPSGLLFAARRSQGDRELWTTNGTAAGTRLVADVAPGGTPAGSNPMGFLADGANAQFLAVQTGGLGWFTSDGTAAGTRRLALIPPTNGSPTLLAGSPLAAPNRTIYTLLRSYLGARPWRLFTRPANGGKPRQVKAFTTTEPDSLGLLGSRLLFVADGLPWSSNGVAASTRVLTSATTSLDTSSTFAIGSSLAYFADTSGGPPLWKTDGTPGGTSPIEPANGPLHSASCLTTLGNRVVFFGADGQSSGQLWVSDGTAEGTMSIGSGLPTHLCPQRPNQRRQRLWTTAERAFMVDEHCGGVWSSDGTPGGTQQVLTAEDLACTSLQPFAATSTHVFAWAEGTPTGSWLVALDGSVGGIEAVAPLIATNTPQATRALVRGDQLLVIGLDAGSFANTLWRSDGSAAGSEPLLQAGQAPEWIGGLLPFDQRTLFAVLDEHNRPTLWETDGTVAGTRAIGTLGEELLGGPLEDAVAVGGKLFYRGFSRDHGAEPWEKPLEP